MTAIQFAALIAVTYLGFRIGIAWAAAQQRLDADLAEADALALFRETGRDQ